MYFTNFRTYKSACTYFSPTQLSELCFCVYNAALFFPEKITKHIQFPVDTFMFPVRKMGVRASVCAKSTESCPMDYSPPGSSVHGILLARILKWVAISASRRSFLPRDWTHVFCSSYIERGFFKAEPLGKLKGNKSIFYLQRKVITQR